MLTLPEPVLLLVRDYYPAPVWGWLNQRLRRLTIDIPSVWNLFRSLPMRACNLQQRDRHHATFMEI